MIARTNQYGVTSYSRANPSNSPTKSSFAGRDGSKSASSFGGNKSNSRRDSAGY
jgi:hypothetical protein